MVVISAPSACTANVRQEYDALPVDQHRAGTARALVAALLRAGQLGVLAQHVQQRGAVVHGEFTIRRR